MKPIRVRQKERDASLSPSPAADDSLRRRAHVAIDAVPEQLLAQLSTEFALCVSILCLLNLFHERIDFGASFARRFIGYICGHLGEGYVWYEPRVSSWNKMGTKPVDAMGGGMKDRGSTWRRQCGRLGGVEKGVG